jgi:hypothetical protein
MATSTALTTQLDAVNTMLAIIGESPVNSVENSGLVDVVIAKRTLDEVNREIQLRGWHWNTETDYPLSPTFPLPGTIYLPANTLSVDAMDPSQDLVQRGLRLYDRKRRSYTFDQTATVVIKFLLEFNELPETARQFIMIRAARKFQDRVVGSQTLSGFNKNDELNALVALRNDEAENADYTILNKTDTIRILGWPRNPGGFV